MILFRDGGALVDTIGLKMRKVFRMKRCSLQPILNPIGVSLSERKGKGLMSANLILIVKGVHHQIHRGMKGQEGQGQTLVIQGLDLRQEGI